MESKRDLSFSLSSRELWKEKNSLAKSDFIREM